MRSATKALFFSMLLPVAAAAQVGRPTVVVTDTSGRRIAFAWVQLSTGITRVANDSGAALIDADPVDSLRLIVRRMGYAPFEGKVARDTAANTYAVVLTPTPQTLKRMAITTSEENRLFRNGFYERLDNARKLATPSRFFAPEDLDSRAVSRTSQIFEGIPFIRVVREGRKNVVQGRARCPANILMDGRAPVRMIEHILTPGGEAEIARRARQLPSSMPEAERIAIAKQDVAAGLQSIDELLSSGSIAAIETYASANQAPIELRNQAKDMSCVLIAIWTGPRQ